MRYRLAKALNHTHTQGVTQVTFSSDGHYLATSDLAGKLCLWDACTWRLLHTYTPGTSILSIAWSGHAALICGLGDGTIACIRLGKEEVKVEGEWSHSYPVEHLSLSKKRVASGAHRELFIWKRVEDLLTIEKELELSVLLDCDSDEEVIVTGLHWHGLGRRDAGMLITSFMHQGICIYDSRNWSVLRQIGEHRVGFMATSALSPDGTRIVVSNLINGVDVYDTDTGALILTVPHEIGKGHPLPVRFIHGGHAIASVNGVGCVKVWYIDGSSSRKLQTLAAPGNCRIMSLGAHYDASIDQFMIVAGTLAEDLQSPVLLWKAEEARTRDAVVADNGLDQHRSFFGSRMAKGMFFSCVVVAASAIALLLVYYYPHDASNMARHGPVYAQTNAHRLGTILLDIRHWQY